MEIRGPSNLLLEMIKLIVSSRISLLDWYESRYHTKAGWFQEFNASGMKVHRNLSVRVVIVSSRCVRVLCNLLIEFGMKRLRYWGVKSFKIL